MKMVMLKVYHSKYFAPVVLILVGIVLVCMHQAQAFAGDMVIPAEAAPPAWFMPVVNLVVGLPYVGPYLLVAIKYLGLLASVLTILSATVQALLILPEVAARFMGAPKLADQIKSVSDVVLPYLKYFSMYNVQKK